MPEQKFEGALNAFKFLGWLKKFEPAQNFLGPVKNKALGCLGSCMQPHKPVIVYNFEQNQYLIGNSIGQFLKESSSHRQSLDSH